MESILLFFMISLKISIFHGRFQFNNRKKYSLPRYVFRIINIYEAINKRRDYICALCNRDRMSISQCFL